MKKSDEAGRIDALVTDAVLLNARMKIDSAQMAEIKKGLFELAPGKYDSAVGSLQIVHPAAALKPGEEQIAAARELAGDKADRLFARAVSYKAVTGFREICRAIFTPAKAQKIIALCEVESSPQVRFS